MPFILIPLPCCLRTTQSEAPGHYVGTNTTLMEEKRNEPGMHLQLAAVAALTAVAEQHMLQLISWGIRPGLSVDHEHCNRCGSRCLQREVAGQQTKPGLAAVVTPNCCFRLMRKDVRSEQEGVVQAPASANHLGLRAQFG